MHSSHFSLGNVGLIISWFYTFDLLRSLHNMDPKFKKYDHCIIFADQYGTIGCILSVNNSDNLDDIEIFLLCALKGLTSITPSYHQNNVSLTDFKLVVTCFNKCFETTINLKEMVSINKIITEQDRNHNNNLTPSTSSIISTRTLCSLAQPQPTGIISVDSKEETWIISDSMISQIQPIPFLFTRRTRQINPVIHDFNRFSRITYIKGNDLLGNHLMLATDGETLTRCYVIETEDFEEFLLEQDSRYQFVELDDLLPIENKGTLFLHIYDNFVVQLTNDQLVVRSLTSPFETKIIFTIPLDCHIDNCVYQDNKLVMWDLENSRVWYVADLSQKFTSECKESQTFNRLIKNYSNFSFHIITSKSDPTDCNIVLRNPVGIFSTPWKDFVYNTSENITFVKSIPIHDFAMCNKKLCIFLFYNNAQKPMIRITDLSAGVVSSWDHISFCFRPGERFQFELLNETTIACFSTRHFYLIYLNNSDDIICEEIQLPFFGRKVVLLDLFYNQSSNALFCLYDDGLRIIKLTYLSQSKMDHILPKNKDKDKIFLYLEKLNRLLIIHPQRKYWYLMKLENGTIRFLDPQILQLEKYPLQQIVEVKSKNSNTFLLLKFQNCISYIMIMVKNSKIIVKVLDTFKTTLSFPINKLVPTTNQDVFATIGTSKKCEDTDEDVNGYLLDPTRYEDVHCNYFEYVIRNDRIEVKEDIPLNWLNFFSILDYFIFVDSILINTSSGIYIYVNFKLPFYKKLISTPKENSNIRAIKVNENMLLVRKSQSGEDIFNYIFVYNDEIFDVVKDPEKYWKLQNNNLIKLNDSDKENELSENCTANSTFLKDKWSITNCLTKTFRYYYGHRSLTFFDDIEVESQEKIRDYLIGLPLVFPKLSLRQRKLYPVTLEIPKIYYSQFDSKNKILSILSIDGSFRQYKNEPTSLTVYNTEKITPSDMMNEYIHRGGSIKLHEFSIDDTKQQGFVCQN